MLLLYMSLVVGELLLSKTALITFTSPEILEKRSDF